MTQKERRDHEFPYKADEDVLKEIIIVRFWMWERYT